MNELQIFENEDFGEIRTVTINNEPWFVGKDVTDILGYTNSSKALADHVDEEDKLNNESLSSLGQRGGWLINESGLYSLILSSKMPTAKKFKRWVTSEVLPSLRKTGSYTIKETTDERLQIMKMNAQTRMAQTFLKLANVDTLSETYKNVLVSKASEVLAGEQIIPLPAIEQRKAYSAGDIGNMFGVSANKIGRIANQNNLKQPEYGEYRRDKSKYSSHECDTWVYFDSAVPVFAGILNQCK